MNPEICKNYSERLNPAFDSDFLIVIPLATFLAVRALTHC
jgi:hypothetical protein